MLGRQWACQCWEPTVIRAYSGYGRNRTRGVVISSRNRAAYHEKEVPDDRLEVKSQFLEVRPARRERLWLRGRLLSTQTTLLLSLFTPYSPVSTLCFHSTCLVFDSYEIPASCIPLHASCFRLFASCIHGSLPRVFQYKHFEPLFPTLDALPSLR